MNLFDPVIGQDAAVRQLRAAAVAPVHAYLFVGPPGVGKRTASKHFAAAVLCPNGGDGTCDVCRRVLNGSHPDALEFERSGASILKSDVDEIIRVAVRTPMEAERKVLTLVDLHLVPETQAPRLLKTIEEPPPSTIFVILADTILPHFITIASRCVQIEFGLLSERDIIAALVAEGVGPMAAGEVASASGGRLDRARLLARDEGFAARREAWRSVASRLDGRGATVASLVDELAGLVDPLMVPLRARQAAEIDAASKSAEMRGEKFLKGDAKALADQHKREERRLRIDELKAGLSALTGAYRERLSLPEPAAQRRAIDAVAAIAKANELLERNPNETLLIQHLFLQLGRAG